MKEHRYACHLSWTGAAAGPTSSYAAYAREHVVAFDGKPSLTLSADPTFRGDATLLNPEELLLAALASCHCLSYLALCARGGVAVVAYEDAATGTMAVVDGVVRFTEVILRPRVRVAAGADVERARELHARAHRECFIANSVAFPVRNEPEVAASES